MIPRRLVIILLCSAAFYGLLLPTFYVGYFNDDTLAILAAKSLLSGRYVHLQLPDHPFLQDPLPGFSLLLAPWVAWVEPHWFWLKLVTLVTQLGALITLWALLEGHLESRLQTSVVALYAMNPVVAAHSSVVLPDIFFTLLILLAFLIGRHALKTNRVWMYSLTGIVTGMAAMVRPQGLLLIPALITGLVYRRAFKAVIPFTLLSLPLALMFWLRNTYLPHQFNTYSNLWAPQLTEAAQHPLALVHAISLTIQTITVETLLGLQGHFLMAVQGVASLLIVIGVLYGFMRSGKAKPFSESLVVGIWVYLTTTLVLHTLWVAVTPRYFLPILPFLLSIFVWALSDMSKRARKPWLLRGGVILMFAACLVQDTALIQAAYTRPLPASRVYPSETLSWITHNTPETSRFLSNKNTFLFLQTKRSSYSLGGERTLDEFRNWLITDRIDYAMLKIEPLLNPKRTQQWGQAKRWMDSLPKAFPLVYSNSQEQTLVYKMALRSEMNSSK